MNTSINLALCIWKTEKLTSENSYIILSFNPEGKLELRIPKLKYSVTSTKEAVYRLFGFSDPPKLSGKIPRTSLKQLLTDLNPIHFFNPNYIPASAFMPKNDDEIYLCIEVPPGQLKLGLIDKTFKTGSFIMESNSENTDLYLNFFGTACVQFICYGSIQKEIIKTLKTLLLSLLSRLPDNLENNVLSPN